MARTIWLNDNIYPHLENPSDWEDAKTNGAELVSINENGSEVSVVYKHNGKLCAGKYSVGVLGPQIAETSGDEGGGGGSSGMENPMTSAGDIIIGGDEGTPTRLGKGPVGSVLKSGENGIGWGDDEGGMPNPMTSAGDIIVGGEGGEPTALPIGTSGQFLGTDTSGVFGWNDQVFVKNGTTIKPKSQLYDDLHALDLTHQYNSFGQTNAKLGFHESWGTMSLYADALYEMRWPTSATYGRAKSWTCRNTYQGSPSIRTIIFPYTDLSGANLLSGLVLEYASGGNHPIIKNFSGTLSSATAMRCDPGYSSISKSGTNGLMWDMSYSACIRPDWSGTWGQSQRTDVTIGAGISIYSSGSETNHGNQPVVALLVKKGITQLKDNLFVEGSNAYINNTIYTSKIIVGGRKYPPARDNRTETVACNGIVYGYGETSARDALTSAGKDPGRQYYTTDDNRVNVYNNTTSGWDKIAYLSDVGGSGGFTAEIGNPYSTYEYDCYSQYQNFLSYFYAKKSTINEAFIIPMGNRSIEFDARPTIRIYEGEDFGTANEISSASANISNVENGKPMKFEFESPVSLDTTKSHWFILNLGGIYDSQNDNKIMFSSFETKAVDEQIGLENNMIGSVAGTDIDLTEYQVESPYQTSVIMPYVVLS